MTEVEVRPHRSHSQISTFARCGEAYRLEKVAKAPRAPAAWFTQGTAFHESVEAWEKSARTLTVAEARDIYATVYDAEIAANLEAWPDTSVWLTGGRTKPETDIKNRREKGLAQVAGYIEYARAADWTMAELPDGSPAIEWKFSIDFDGIEVIGAVDQGIVWGNGTLGMRDLKTGTKTPDWAFQLAIYGLAWEYYFGQRVSWGDFYMAKNNAPTDPLDLEPFTFSKVSRWVHNMDRAVSLGLFVPNVGDACRVCGVRRWCDAIGADPETYSPELYDDKESE